MQSPTSNGKAEFEVLSVLSQKPTLLKNLFLGLNGVDRKLALETLDTLEKKGYVQNLGLKRDPAQFYSYGTAFRITREGIHHRQQLSRMDTVY